MKYSERATEFATWRFTKSTGGVPGCARQQAGAVRISASKNLRLSEGLDPISLSSLQFWENTQCRFFQNWEEEASRGCK